MYLYFVDTQVNTIILFNYLSFLVFYNVFLKILRNIKALSTAFIKGQVSNSKLVSTWSNFKYRKNITRENIEDIVKFRSVTIAL